MGKVDPLIGKQVGNYHILTKINAGSFGSVYKGKHIIFDDEPIVAIKVLHNSLYTQQERTGFIQEARILKKLKHPHILQILDAGFQDEIPYIITEYAAGGSLRDYMVPNKDQLNPLQQAITTLAQIGQGLHYAHQQNIVHRDLKPENVLFNSRGVALLADFGIAAILSNTKTLQIGVGGTPAYMAPEQFEGFISAKSDQYALGCIGYELLTGHKPFIIAAPNMEAWWYHHAKVYPDPPSKYNTHLPIYIEQAILRAMAKKRSDRFDNVATFISMICSPFTVADDITLLLKESTVEVAGSIEFAQKSQFKGDDSIALKSEEEELFWRLRALRKRIADELEVPPYVVFEDLILRTMAQRRPQNRSQFAQIPGVGSNRLDMYSEAFLNEIRDYRLDRAAQ